MSHDNDMPLWRKQPNRDTNFGKYPKSSLEADIGSFATLQLTNQAGRDLRPLRKLLLGKRKRFSREAYRCANLIHEHLSAPEYDLTNLGLRHQMATPLCGI